MRMLLPFLADLASAVLALGESAAREWPLGNERCEPPLQQKPTICAGGRSGAAGGHRGGAALRQLLVCQVREAMLLCTACSGTRGSVLWAALLAGRGAPASRMSWLSARCARCAHAACALLLQPQAHHRGGLGAPALPRGALSTCCCCRRWRRWHSSSCGRWHGQQRSRAAAGQAPRAGRPGRYVRCVGVGASMALLQAASQNWRSLGRATCFFACPSAPVPLQRAPCRARRAHCALPPFTFGGSNCMELSRSSTTHRKPPGLRACPMGSLAYGKPPGLLSPRLGSAQPSSRPSPPPPPAPRPAQPWWPRGSGCTR